MYGLVVQKKGVLMIVFVIVYIKEIVTKNLASEKRLITNVTNCKLFFHSCGITWCGSCSGSEKVVPMNAKGWGSLARRKTDPSSNNINSALRKLTGKARSSKQILAVTRRSGSGH